MHYKTERCGGMSLQSSAEGSEGADWGRDGTWGDLQELAGQLVWPIEEL